jgi:hypothetical protein
MLTALASSQPLFSGARVIAGSRSKRIDFWSLVFERLDHEASLSKKLFAIFGAGRSNRKRKVHSSRDFKLSTPTLVLLEDKDPISIPFI